MGTPLYQVDAFADRPFAGNPAAVCILSQPVDETWMQNVAREMNLAETAFLYAQKDGFSLRWFTPSVEVELCGHATLASAHVLWETGLLASTDEARFYTRSGLLTAALTTDGIRLDFPATPDEPTEAPPGLSEALGVTPRYVGKSPFDYLVEVDSERTVQNIAPDLAQLKAFDVRGVMVTSRATSPDYDFVSRFFAPGVGIDEDPVTGSAHCCLGPFWSQRLGKDEMRAYQASKRGGALRVHISGDRVHLIGKAVTVLYGELVNER